MGRDWLFEIRAKSLQPAASPSHKSAELQKHKAVFRDKLCLVKGVTAKLPIDQAAQPRFCKARTVPFALREQVEKELERLEEADVIRPVQFSEWAAPIVSVLKRDGSVRVCGDYKITVNQIAKPDSYPLPRIDEH